VAVQFFWELGHHYIYALLAPANLTFWVLTRGTCMGHAMDACTPTCYYLSSMCGRERLCVLIKNTSMRAEDAE